VDVLQEGISRAEQEHTGEEVPLHFGESSGSRMKGLARNGVTGTEEYRRKNQPLDALSDASVESVNQAGYLKQKFHIASNLVVSLNKCYRKS
jgi:hypothetical protein